MATKRKFKTSIKTALGKPGLLHKQLHVPKGEKIPAAKLAALAKSGGKKAGKAQLLLNLARSRSGKKKGKK